MKALVTGATGLIGTALCKRLKGMGWSVCGISSKDGWVGHNDYNAIFHMACYSSPSKFMSDPLETIRVNTDEVENLIVNFLKTNGTFLFASSSEIYGNATIIPTPEDYPGNTSPLSYRAPYTESKRMGETICSLYENNLNVKIARICSVYGPGLRLTDDRVMGQFMRQAIENGRIEMKDQGLQRRPWLYIDDCVEMLIKIATEGKQLVYNVAGKELASIAEIAEVIASHTQASVGVPDSDNGVMGAPVLVQPSIERYESEFGGIKMMPLREGVRRMIDWNLSQIATPKRSL
jgi:UDP-glucuronate decarboxylase